MISLSLPASIDLSAAADAAQPNGDFSPRLGARRPHSPTYTAGRVGERLGVSADTVRRWWPQWQSAQGFPPPLPLTGGRALLRWDSAAVEAWRSRRGSSDQPDIDTTDWAAVARARGLALDRGQNPDRAA